MSERIKLRDSVFSFNIFFLLVNESIAVETVLDLRVFEFLHIFRRF